MELGAVNNEMGTCELVSVLCSLHLQDREAVFESKGVSPSPLQTGGYVEEVFGLVSSSLLPCCNFFFSLGKLALSC